MDKTCEKAKGSIQETGGAFLRDFYFACAVMMRMRPPSGIPPPGASPISPPGMPPMPPPGIIWSSEEGCACGEVVGCGSAADEHDRRRDHDRLFQFFSSAFLSGRGRRTACGAGCARSARRPSSGRRAASGITYSLLEKMHKTAS